MFTCNICRFTDCESCTRPISTNPASMEAGEYWLSRGTCFVARRLEVVAVAGLLWISWRVSAAPGFRVLFICFSSNFECTRPAASIRPPCLIYLSIDKSMSRVRDVACVSLFLISLAWAWHFLRYCRFFRPRFACILDHYGHARAANPPCMNFILAHAEGQRHNEGSALLKVQAVFIK